MTTILLSVILEWLGVDRFYAGHIGLGVLTFGGFGIWYMILISIYEFKDIEGKVIWDDYKFSSINKSKYRVQIHN